MAEPARVNMKSGKGKRKRENGGKRLASNYITSVKHRMKVRLTLLLQPRWIAMLPYCPILVLLSSRLS